MGKKSKTKIQYPIRIPMSSTELVGNAVKFGKISALQHAISVCKARKGVDALAVRKMLGYSLACDEIRIFLEAAVSRVENGEDMAATNTVQGTSCTP